MSVTPTRIPVTIPHSEGHVSHAGTRWHPKGSDTPPAVINTENEPHAEVLRFEDVFAALPPRQQVWLAVRATTETDTEANEELGITAAMSSRWKSSGGNGSESFRFCYERMAKAGANRERDLVAAIERSNAVRAAVEKQRILMKPWSECNRSEMAVKSAMITDALERVMPKRRAIEHRSTKSMKELVMDGHLEPPDLPPLAATESYEDAEMESQYGEVGEGLESENLTDE